MQYQIVVYVMIWAAVVFLLLRYGSVGMATAPARRRQRAAKR